jgi:hypothetical protein
MKLLKEVKIFGRTFNVEYLDFDKKLQGNDLSGSIGYREQKIQIDSKSHQEFQGMCLLHEIIHELEHSLSLKMEEDTVRRLGHTLYQVFKDNDLFKE